MLLHPLKASFIFPQTHLWNWLLFKLIQVRYHHHFHDKSLLNYLNLKDQANFQKFKKTSASQTHFGFTNIGSEMHSFRGTAI